YRIQSPSCLALIWQISFFRLRQPEARDESDHVGGRADERRRIRELERHGRTWHRAHQLRGDQRGTRADHPAADIGRKTLTGASEICRIDAGQVVPPETELRDRR